MLKSLIRPGMICVPFLLGYCCPKAHILAGAPFNGVRIALMLMVFITCLGLHLNDLRLRKDHGKVLFLNFAAGILPYCLMQFVLPNCKGDPALTAFFTGITPTATAAPVVVSLLGERVGFALTGFVLTNLSVSLGLLILLPLITGNFTGGFFLSVLTNILLVTAVPFGCAMGLRSIFPKLRELPKKIRTFSLLLWSFCLFTLAAVARQYFIDHPEGSLRNILTAGGISLLLCLFNFWAGGFFASHRYKRESSQILGQKNTTFTIFLALQFATPPVVLGPIFYILWHNLWNAAQMFLHDRRKLRKMKQRNQS